MSKIKTAMILVGGEGNRLAEIFPGQPTSLVPIFGKPYLSWLLEELKTWGLEKVLLLTSKKTELFKSFILQGVELGLQVQIIAEEKPLGAVGAVKSAIHHVPDSQSEFLVMYGKLFVAVDMNSFLHETNSENISWQLQVNSKDVGVFRIHKTTLQDVPANQVVTFEKDWKDSPLLHKRKQTGVVLDLSFAKDYSVLNANKVLQAAKQESEFLPPLLMSLMHRGQIFVTDDMVAECLQMLPDLLQFQKLKNEDLSSLRQLKTTDLVFVSGLSVDQIFKLAGQTAATLIQVGEQNYDASLLDYVLSERKLRSALMSLKTYWESLQLSQKTMGTKARRPALFLDRDGVVIEWVDYLKDPQQVRMQSEVVELIRQANHANWWVVIVSNQSGLGRNYFTWDQCEAVHFEMMRQLAEQKVWVDRVLMAPYYGDSNQAEFLYGKSWRKPRPGMMNQACEELSIDRSRSIMIGDNVSDMMAGAVAQIKNLCLLESPRVAAASAEVLSQKDIESWRSWPLNSRTEYGLEIPRCAHISELEKKIRPLIK